MNYFFFAACFMRSSLLSTILRMRMLFGVISTSSSSAMNSRDCSRESTVCGVSFSASSEPEARVFVACFYLQTLMTMSSPFGLLPTIMPS